jgi:malate dehydrogenase (oxaloacetate-decarboxylating)
MENVYEKSIELHALHGGKLEIKSKVPLTTREDLSLAYTPGIGAVSEAVSQDPDRLWELSIKKNTVAIISDGSAVLGLGNLGPAGAIPVLEGKAILFKEFGGVDAFPIALATQDTDEIIRTIKAIAPVFGGINLEDISAPRCFEIERQLRAELPIPIMHDDQHGTAVVVLAALLNALKLRGLGKEAKIVMNGAGAAGTAIAHILLGYGFKDLVVCDSQGAIYDGRPGLTGDKFELARMSNPGKVRGLLSDVLAGAHVFVGVSKAGLLTADMIRSMSERPIVFALANPVPEIMPDEAKAAGVFIIATGRSDFPNQINNVLAFPGIFRGALDNRIGQFKPEMFVRAAETLANYVLDPSPEQLLPDPLDRGVGPAVAKVIC